MLIHLNWGLCSDWEAVRTRLGFLKTTLYGNFADINGDFAKLKRQLLQRGFKFECEPYPDGGTDAVLIRFKSLDQGSAEPVGTDTASPISPQRVRTAGKFNFRS